ncbi:DUF305 domain-containing protein [Glutamicibacter sp.]|uniref:DUF305 domain-containing protein n=1 Tax=Glutamicibacter sp. TaxID=1931995 RepID=UPI0028BEAE4F|nr:DUF305 domain-containing protein [Glutamicibacter sp.]
MKKLLTFGALSASLAIVLSGCASSPMDSGMEHSMSEMGSQSPSETSAEVNTADDMFISMMIAHHQQALELSDIVLNKEGIPEDVTALATKIKDAQTPEIATLEQWQKELKLSTPSNHSMGSEDGMVSEDEIKNLTNASGDEAATLFLQQMVAHHEGAVDMAKEEISQGKYQPAIDMAQNIVTSQRDEIDQMKKMLEGK